MAGVLGISLKHAATKQAQTSGLLERSHASIKQALKIDAGERRTLWRKYVSIAVVNYNTSYHTSIGCEPNRVFHGRIPYNPLDLKMGIRPQEFPSSHSQIAQDVLEQTEMIFQDVRKNAMQAYIKPISNTKRNMLKKPMPQNLNKPITSTYYSQKQAINGAKFPGQIFGGLDHRLLKRCNRTINIWYAIRRKFFIE